jgi:hypothetical protein
MKKKERIQTGRCRRAFRKEGRGEHSDGEKVEESVQTGGWKRAFRHECGEEHSDMSVEKSIQT